MTVVKKRAVKTGEQVFHFDVVGMSAAPVEASEDHPLLAVQTDGLQKRKIEDWSPDWVAAKELQVGDYVAYPVNREVKENMAIDMAEFLKIYVATDQWVYQQITPEGAAAYEYSETREQRAFNSGELQQVAVAQGWAVSTLQSAAARYRRGHRTPRLPRHLPWSKDFATILGYYLAEGHVEGTRITFSLHKKETWICDELDEAFGRLLGLAGVRSAHGENGLTYRINASSFAEFLKNYGGHLAWNKHLPPEAVHLPEDILLELVRCLINGDGGLEQVYRDNGTGRPCRTSSVTYTTTSLPLALKLRELLLYLGVIGKVHTTPVRGDRRKHDIHRVKVSGQMALDLWKKLGWGGSATIEVKKDTTRSFIKGNYAYFRIQKKTVLEGVDFVYGFQVDGDKSFCVPSCASHNTTINLMDWRDRISAEIARWRYDVNYIPILPLPVGTQTVGGDGRALLLTSEIQQWSEQIINGMQVPIEFIKGGLSYAGTNVSMRMLENAFIGYILRQKQQARFIMKQVAAFMGWPEVKLRFKPFKMADDLQRKAYRFQLNSAGKISDTTLLADDDLSQEEENQLMIRETDSRVEATKKQQLAMAQIQGEAQLIMAKFQVKAQQAQQQAMTSGAAPGEPGGAEGQMAGGGPGSAEAQPGQQMPQQQQQMPPELQVMGPNGEAIQGAPPALMGSGDQNTPGSFLSAISSQLKGDQKMDRGGQGDQLNVDLPSFAAQQAQQIATMPPKFQEMALANLEAPEPRARRPRATESWPSRRSQALELRRVGEGRLLQQWTHARFPINALRVVLLLQSRSGA